MAKITDSDLLQQFRGILAAGDGPEPTHGARNIVAPDRPWLHFKNEGIVGLKIENARVISEMGVEFKQCRISKLRISSSDLDYFTISGGTIRDAAIDQSSLFGFSIMNCKQIDGLKINDSYFGLHVWNETDAADVDRLETDLDSYLPEGKTVVQSPYLRGWNLYASLEGNTGKNIEINRPMGGYAHVGLDGNRFDNFKMTGPGLFVRGNFAHNSLSNSSIGDMIFYGGVFECNTLANTPHNA